MTKPGNQRSIDTQIDANLRRIFEEDVEQDLPDRLKELLAQLDAAEPPEDGGSSDGGGSDGGGSDGGPSEGGAGDGPDGGSADSVSGGRAGTGGVPPAVPALSRAGAGLAAALPRSRPGPT